MTGRQKEQINAMRLRGDSHAAIAVALGLSRNTVKSYCLRNLHPEPLEEKASPVKSGVCNQCGKGFVLCPGHRQRRFCSDHCRMAWWYAHRDLLNSKGLLEHTCACCGKPFMSYERQRRKYCSHGCYIAHGYKKEREPHE